MRILILRNLFFPGCPNLCAMPFLPPTQHAKQNCLQLQRKRRRAGFKQPAAARNGQTFRHKFKTDYKCKLGFKKSGNLKSSYSQPRKYAPSLRICRTRSHRKSNIPAEALSLQVPPRRRLCTSTFSIRHFRIRPRGLIHRLWNCRFLQRTLHRHRLPQSENPPSTALLSARIPYTEKRKNSFALFYLLPSNSQKHSV